MTTKPPSPTSPATTLAEPAPPSRAASWLLRTVRFPMILGIASIFAASAAMLFFSAAETYGLLVRLMTPGGAPVGEKELMLKSIKLVDLVLLATVLHITAVGLYELFIDDRLPVPAWLRIVGIEDLKQKLIGVVVTVLGVVFLEQAISWNGERNLLPFGVAVAAVIAALSYFLGFRSGKPTPADDNPFRSRHAPADNSGRPSSATSASPDGPSW